MTLKTAAPLLLMGIGIGLAGCKVGPNYVKPQASAPPAYEESAPDSTQSGDWKPAAPSDSALGGSWWQLFSDPELNQLEQQVATANQSLKASEANFRAARGYVAINRSYLAPTIGTAPAIGTVRDSLHQPYFNTNYLNNGEGSFSLPFDINYEIDLWGRIRRGVTASRAQAQASAADLATALLSLQAELAMDYFDLRATDTQLQLLNDTVKAYQEALKLTEDRHDGGAAPLSDVTQARTQLQAAQVIQTDLNNERAADQHAIAILIGLPPAEFHLDALPRGADHSVLPKVPLSLPSQLLERRPDIASMERQMAAANEQIGIAKAAYYPTLSLSGSAGFMGTSALNWLTWPSRFWAVGPTLSETLFDAGRRKAGVAIAQANYDATVANYRQTVLTSFGQVEDNLAALRILETEADQQHAATHSAEQTLDLFTTRYQGGVDTYLQVITSQTAALMNERNDIEIQLRRQQASVLLIKALGGGWTTQQLPKV
ncbi:efflux transporter outer membrane subunit [Acidicapsa acidisoli]|uniref:efflux transporter outer membrane subunit n=1 Tax=Acidicapsa acidisoli TaxID=1615681 RepID=UPI0021DFE7E7|nr:efflux transporter outer membrane subunit [Acidicapsa acidisoli]